MASLRALPSSICLARPTLATPSPTHLPTHPRATPSPCPSLSLPRRAGGGRLRVGVRASLMEALPREYGAVVLTAVSSVILTQWQGILVAKARKAAGVAYPKMYDDQESSQVFNCTQRAHQNTLEQYPAFLALLLLSGLAYPLVASGCGMVWVFGRVFYSLGYATGDPMKRHKGMWGTFGLLGLLIAASVAGVKQLF